MAGLATAAIGPFGKLPEVNIFVTVITALEAQRTGQPAILMALFTGNLNMLALKGKFSERVVERLFINSPPAGGIMTFFAILAQIATMGILVATRTI